MTDEEYIEAYRQVFQEKTQRRAGALELDEKVANLGAAVIEKGARDLLKEQDVDIEKIEESNEQLSMRLAERLRTVDEELSKAPEDMEEERQRYAFMMKQRVSAQQEDPSDPCVESPPRVIFTDIPRTCSDGCRVEMASDRSLGRAYPVLVVRGTGWNQMRTAEVYCEYLWAFSPRTTGLHYINPHIEFHGRVVMAFEHHCYSDSSGTGYDFELTMGHAQPTAGTVSPVFTRVPLTLPHVAGTLRYDGFRWPHYECHLQGGHRVYIHVGLRFWVSARSRYASVNFNFGDPRSDNFIGMPWLCYLGPGDF